VSSETREETSALTRFSDDDYDEYFPNQGELWHANVQRALSGQKGQAALRELEEVLIEMPKKRLISSRLALNDEVCVMGALAVKRRVEQGETREAVMEYLERLLPINCEKCYHSRDEHDEDGGCRRCRELDKQQGFQSASTCAGFEASEHHYNEDGALVTAEEGKRIGLTFTLAWHLAQLNDIDEGSDTPEERYERVLTWVQNAIGKQVAA
jgi:hypothetical protein